MKTCETCRWWERLERRSYHVGEWGRCGAAGDSSHEEPAERCKFTAWDYEGYLSGLDTRPDFGCNQWEARESGE